MAQDAGVDMSKYILKSEVVPPVCPKCPDSRTCPRQKPCPPCAPCARCPEPAFECKKVPNYSAASVDSVLPGGGDAGGMMGGGSSGLTGGQEDKDKANGLLNGSAAGAGGAMPKLNSFASFS